MKTMNQRYIFDLKEIIENAGFTSSWEDPLFVLRNPAFNPSHLPSHDYPDHFFIINLPRPPGIPADLYTYARIGISDIGIYFALSVVFCSVLDGLVEADDINYIYDRHAAEWCAAIGVHFSGIIEAFALARDVEYDECIEDSLTRWFAPESAGLIVDLLKKILDG
jgi:hypothetical protein